MTYMNASVTAAVGAEELAHLRMSARSLVVMTVPGPVRIHCLGGTAWITHDGNSDDIVLSQGQRCLLQNARRAFLSSFNGAQLAVVTAARPAARRHGRWSRSRALRFDIAHGDCTVLADPGALTGNERGERARFRRPTVILAQAQPE